MTSHRPVSATEAAAYAEGPAVRAVSPGSTTYLLHEMREVEIGSEAILHLLGLSNQPSLDRICEALRESDARLFVPQQRG